MNFIVKSWSWYVKLFGTILSWNSLKCILWYLLEMSDPFIKNENSFLPFLIEKHFDQKIYFCFLKMRSIFLKKGNLIFSIKLGQWLPKLFPQLHEKKFKIFPFILFEKRRLAQGICRPKAADSPLIFQYSISHFTLVLYYFLRVNLEFYSWPISSKLMIAPAVIS